MKYDEKFLATLGVASVSLPMMSVACASVGDIEAVKSLIEASAIVLCGFTVTSFLFASIGAYYEIRGISKKQVTPA